MIEYHLQIEQDRKQVQEARQIILQYYEALNRYAILAQEASDHITIMQVISDLDALGENLYDTAIECDEWLVYRSIARLHKQAGRLREGIMKALVHRIIG